VNSHLTSHSGVKDSSLLGPYAVSNLNIYRRFVRHYKRPKLRHLSVYRHNVSE